MNPRDQNLIRTVPVLSKGTLQTILVAFAIVFFSSSIKNMGLMLQSAETLQTPLGH